MEFGFKPTEVVGKSAQDETVFAYVKAALRLRHNLCAFVNDVTRHIDSSARRYEVVGTSCI